MQYNSGQNRARFPVVIRRRRGFASRGRWRRGLAFVSVVLVVGSFSCGGDEGNPPVGPTTTTGSAIATSGAMGAGAGRMDAGRVADTGVPVAQDAGSVGDPQLPDTQPEDASEPMASEAATPRTGRVSLVDPHGWERLDADQDPFEDRPQNFSCQAGATSVELLMGRYTFEVNTGLCSYITARQPTTRNVVPGETLKVRVWHYMLTAPNPGEAHIVVEIDGLRLVDERIPIPGPGGLMSLEVPADRAIPAGAPAYFHIHNHGENTYSMVELSTGPAS